MGFFVGRSASDFPRNTNFSTAILAGQRLRLLFGFGDSQVIAGLFGTQHHPLSVAEIGPPDDLLRHRPLILWVGHLTELGWVVEREG